MRDLSGLDHAVAAERGCSWERVTGLARQERVTEFSRSGIAILARKRVTGLARWCRTRDLVLPQWQHGSGHSERVTG